MVSFKIKHKFLPFYFLFLAFLPLFLAHSFSLSLLFHIYYSSQHSCLCLGAFVVVVFLGGCRFPLSFLVHLLLLLFFSNYYMLFFPSVYSRGVAPFNLSQFLYHILPSRLPTIFFHHMPSFCSFTVVSINLHLSCSLPLLFMLFLKYIYMCVYVYIYTITVLIVSQKHSQNYMHAGESL